MQKNSQKDEILTDEQAEEYWNSLSNAIDMIFQKKAQTLSFEKLYQKAYRLIIFRQGEMAYECLQNSIESNLQEMQQQIKKNPPQDVLKYVLTLWTDIKQII